MEDNAKENINARSTDSPEVKRGKSSAEQALDKVMPTIETKLEEKPKHAGGRKTKEYYSAPVQEILNLTAPHAARILQQHIEKQKGYANLKLSLQRACEYVIDHAIGKARQKVEHSGGILTYSELFKSASDLDEKPMDFLADVEELAYKHQQKIAEKTVNNENTST